MSRNSSRQLPGDDHSNQRQESGADRQRHRAAQAEWIDSQTKTEEEDRSKEISKRHHKFFQTRAVLGLTENQPEQQRADCFSHVNRLAKPGKDKQGGENNDHKYFVR